MARPSFQEKRGVAAAIICPESREEHAILHINTEDVMVTQMAYQAGKLLQVSLLDHLIIGREQWLSLKTQGMGFDDK